MSVSTLAYGMVVILPVEMTSQNMDMMITTTMMAITNMETTTMMMTKMTTKTMNTTKNIKCTQRYLNMHNYIET